MMERGGLIALGIVALAMVLQALALIILAVVFGRLRRRLSAFQLLLSPTGGHVQGHLAVALEDLAVTSRLAAQQVRRAHSAVEKTRTDTEVIVGRARRGAELVASAAWTIAPFLQALERGLEGYRSVAGLRRWNRAIDQGLAGYRAVKLAAGVVRPTR
jgi:hypothetical protein